MRVLKLVLAGIVVAVTLVLGLAAAFFAAVLALTLRLFRTFGRQPSSPSSAARPTRASRAARDGAIDVTATEVPSDRPPR
jgi:hypothetical protein